MKGTRNSSTLVAALVAVLILSALVALGWIWRGEPAVAPVGEQEAARAEPDPTESAREATAGATESAAPAERAGEPPALAALRQALAGGDAALVRELAARLRGALREDPELLHAVGAVVVESSESALLRGTLALILGTLEDEDAHSYLLDALAKTGPESGLTRWFLYALGAWKERPEFDERFAFQPDGPWVVETPGGLRLPIRTLVDDPAVLDVVERYLLGAEEGELRRVALQVLRHSVSVERVREAFLDVLDEEPDDDIQASSAEALGHWTLTPDADEATATAVRGRLLEEAARPEKDLLRFRIESTLRSGRLTAGEADAIAELLAARDGNFGSRYFAIEVAGVQAPMLLSDPATQAAGARLQHLLSETLALERDPKLREKAAEHLGKVPGEQSARALVAAMGGDSAWHVRLAAARALGALDAGEAGVVTRDALEQAAHHDADARVRRAALASLSARGR